jgi:hypothetical protein
LKNIIRHARDLYRIPIQRAGMDAVALALEAYDKGLFISFGLEPKDWKDISFSERELLSKFGEELYEFELISQFRYGTLNKPRVEELLSKTLRLAQQAREIQAGFGEIANFERVPDIYHLVQNERLSFVGAVELSQSKQGRNLQDWIESTTKNPKSSEEIWNKYREANEGKGFFSTAVGKTVKALGTCGLTEIVLLPVTEDSSIRHSISGAIAVLLELFGTALLEGWKPVLFFDKLKQTILPPHPGTI